MKTISEITIMKNVKTYICMFLMIMGMCANAWGSGEYTVNITNNLTGCSAKAGNPTSFSSTSTSTVDLYYTVASGKDGESATISVKNGSTEKYGDWMCYWEQSSGSDYVLHLYSPQNWVGNNALTITITCCSPLAGKPTGMSSTPAATSATLSWSAVSGATSYTLYVTDYDNLWEYNVTGTSRTVTGLTAETEYAWTVRAINECVDDDDYECATQEFTTTAAGLKYDITYHVPSCATAPANVVDHASGAYALPNATSNPGLAINGYTFVGWTSNSSYADGTSAPTPLYTDNVSLGSDMHLYAVYSKSQSIAASAITWSLTSADPIVAGDYVISNGQYATGDGTNKVMDNEMTSRGSRIAAKDITMSANKITSEVTSVAWQFAKQGDYWTIYNPYAKKYVAATANEKEATLVSDVTDDAALWTITKSSNTYNIVSKARASEAAKYLKYNSTSDAWACYSQNSAIFLYKTDVNPFEGSKTYTIDPKCTTYSVTYNVNGGTGSVPTDANKYAQGATAIVLGNVNGMTKDGHAFAGWATSSSATSAAYHSGSELTIGDRDVTLYAVWSQVVTITYKDQGNVDCTAENIDDLPTEHVTGGGNTALVAGTKTNYNFRGWYYTSDCDGDAATEIPSARDADLTLYAKWEAMYTNYRWKCPSTTDVTFDPNSGDANDCTGYSQLEIGTSPSVCHNQSRDGYTFDGYTVTQNGTDYVFDAEGTMRPGVTGYTDGSGKWIYTEETLTLYAHWTPIEYTITYVNAVNGTDGVTNSNPTTYTIETVTFVLTDPTKTGYVFGGWYEDAEFNTEANTTIEVGSMGAKTFYAKWNNGSTTITLGKNTSTTPPSPGSVTATYGSGSLEGFTAVADYSGFEVTGYFTKTTGDGVKVITREGTLVSDVAGYTDETGNWIYTGATLTLYAKWQNKTYHVYYEMNGGTNNAGNITEYTYASSGSFTLLEPTAPTGYVFDKWTAQGGSTKVTTISYSVAADQTFVANWTGIKYRVDFDNQGATTTGTTYKENVQFGSAMPPIILPTKLNHEFGGYFSETGGNGTKYYNADGSSAQNWDIAANTTLYAYWIPAKMLMDKNIIRVTSYKDEHVRSYQTITITSDYFATEPDITITEIGKSASAPNPWLQGKVLSKTYSAGHLEAVIAVDYYPRAYDVTDEYIMEITIGGETGHFNVIGRALPETFVIATQIAGQWYVLPSNMSGANTYAGTAVVTKPSAANPTSANASENFGYKMKQEYNYASGAHQEAVRLYSMLTGNNALWASVGVDISNNAQIGSASSNQYEWVLKSEDLVTYQLHNINRDADLKYSNQYKKWGMYAASTDFNNVRLLSRNDVKDLNAKVMEWGTNAILLSYTGDATTMNAYVDGESAQEGLTLTSLGGDQYTLSVQNLDAHPTELLTLNATESAVEKELTLQIPIMVDGEKASTDALFTALGDACQFSDVVVLNGGVLTAATSGQNKVGNLTVYPGGKLSIPNGQTYTVNTLTMRGGYSELEGIYDVPQAYVVGGLTRSNTTASINYELTLDEKQYYDLALPFATDMANVTDETGFDGFDVWMKVYDGETRTTGASGWTWYDWSGPKYPVNPGQGYLIESLPTTSGRKHCILRFPMTVSSMTSGGEPEKAAIPVTAFGFTDGALNDGIRANNAGWNFIANPYMANYGKDEEAYTGKIQMGALVPEMVDDKWTGGYVWDETGGKNIRYVTTYDNGEYIQHPMSTTTLKPFTGFFIQVSQSGSVKFTQDGRQDNVIARSRLNEELPSELELILTIDNGKTSDNTVLLLGDDWSRSNNKEIPDDQSKLMEGASLKLYTIEGEEKMYANAMKVAEAENWIPVGVRTKDAGEYRFAYEDTKDWQYVEKCILWDKDRNEQIDLKTVSEYTVNLEAGNFAERFALNLVIGKNGVVTNIENGFDSQMKAPRKIIYDDKLFILVGGKVYDGTGKLMNK